MEYSEYKLNIIPSPPDKRDWKIEAVIPVEVFPLTLDLTDDLFEVRNQGSQGTCAAMAGATLKEWQEIQDVELGDFLSPQFIYYNREDPNSAGMYMRDLMKILKNKGVCDEDLHQYGNLKEPSSIAFTAALSFKVDRYAAVDTIDGLKNALYTNGPCVIAVPVYNYGGRMWYQRAGDTFLGGHAMTVVGYNEQGFIIRNSWGKYWEDFGHTIFPYEDWELQWEVWSAIDADSNITPPDPDPEPDPKSNWFTKYWWVILAIIISIITILLIT